MSTPFANEELTALLDGELSDADAASLRDELALDPELAQEFAELEAVSRMLARDAPVSAPIDFHAKVMAAVADEPMPVSWWSWLRRPFGLPIEGIALAAAAAAALLLVFLDTDGPAVDGDEVGAIKTVEDKRGRVFDVPEDDAVATQTPELVDPTMNAFEPSTADRDNDGVAQVDLGDTPALDKELQLRKLEGSADSSEQKMKGKGVVEPTLGTTKPTSSPSVQTEQQATAPGTDQEGELANVPYTYRVNTADPEVVWRLQRIAANLGGDVIDQGADAALLQAGNASVRIRVPQAALTELDVQLRKLGASALAAQTDKLYAADTVEVAVNISLVGGTPKKTAAPPNAARQHMEQADDAEQVIEAH